MKSYIGIASNKEQAEREGKFFMMNNDLYLSKKALTQNILVIFKLQQIC